MSRFVGLSLMCLLFMSAQADDSQFSGSVEVFQSYQNGDGEGKFQSESQEFDSTGMTKHDRVEGNIEGGVYKVTNRENLKGADNDCHEIGENSKWIRPSNSTEANLMGRSKVPFGKMFSRFFGSKEHKRKDEQNFRESLKNESPFGFYSIKNRRFPIKLRHFHGKDFRFKPYSWKEMEKIPSYVKESTEENQNLEEEMKSVLSYIKKKREENRLLNQNFEKEMRNILSYMKKKMEENQKYNQNFRKEKTSMPLDMRDQNIMKLFKYCFED